MPERSRPRSLRIQIAPGRARTVRAAVCQGARTRPDNAALHDALGYPARAGVKAPIGWVWCPDGRTWCSPACLPQEIRTEILEGRADDLLGEIYPWTTDSVEPGDSLTCTSCGTTIYREPLLPREDDEP